ncbi:type 2 lanthipeptide synthetase LanM family protein [Anabaena catenula]|uniref:Type 2 lantipeptide synthetase LanM n=1 Tax=Anabaena catenula FACHB-362 TaxID=2692877 RepID=A0ABR8JD14_9NOST|nr:type 2 lanthipeptide synthetase LanM family protein [Anabaena catenula]MBD2694676.1 type 2 lantipeptide synthetase LanM [Anabaena catenula FACHB-362]
MNRTHLQSPDWYRATLLKERKERTASLPIIEEREKFITDIARHKIHKWQSQSPFNEDSFFHKRLSLDNLTESELLYLLSEPSESVKSRLFKKPTWLLELEQTFSDFSPSDVLTRICLDSELIEVEFLYAIEPLINQALEKLDQEIKTLLETRQDLPLDPQTIRLILLADLPKKLLSILSRTMVLELNVARLQGVLKNETSKERFQSFIERLKQPKLALAIFQEYPVLARQLTIVINHWLKNSLEFIRHLCSDWEDTINTFNQGTSPGLLVALEGGLGDSHRGGQSVMIAKFESGLKLVYKPKNLDVDVHFQELLAWLNKRGNHPPFQLLKILNYGDHGWVEFIEAKSCTNVEQIQRFYERQGGYLALFYALAATDFHHENLIAISEYPIMIDLEALFHPYNSELDNSQSQTLANLQMAYSVLRVGLLPRKNWGNDKLEGIDISGLGGLPGQLIPRGVSSWEGKGTDEMRLTREQVEMPVGKNLPSLDGKLVNVLDYSESIIAGFTSIYQLLVKHRDELLSLDSPLTRFANDEVRVILRNTATYAKILWESCHPDLLRDALDRERCFDRLWIDVKYRPELEKVIAAEQQDLWQEDIPIFTTRPMSRDLYTSTDELIPDYFTQSGMTIVQQHLQQLNQQDMNRQIWFIRASLATLGLETEQPESAKREPLHLTSIGQDKKTEEKGNRERLLSGAIAIGDHLEELALRGEDDATWLGLNWMDEKQWSVRPLKIDLYDGISGIVFFLAYLGELTGEKRYKNLAEAALRTVQRQIIERDQGFIKSIGAFNGLGGIIYTLSHLGSLWNKPSLLSEAQALTELLPSLIAEDERLDIIAGSAGCIAGLITLYRCQPDEKILALARQCGERLVSQATPKKQGRAWVIKKGSSEALSGFSHGAAGIAWALLELAALTGERDFYQAALDGITYERSLFYPKLSNWLDLREAPTKDKSNQHYCMTAWCHGAPGIGLARLRCLPYIDDLAIRAEINTAIKTTLEQGFGFNHSLCHGDLGNLELILQASSILQDSQYQIQLDCLTTLILDSIDKQGWLCGVPLGVETPGLMTGLAGIGYELLRLAEPEKIPSVLVLEPPKL